MNRKRIAFVAPSVGGGMGPSIAENCETLRKEFDIELIVPGHYPYKEEWLSMFFLPTAQNKYIRALKMLNPVSHFRLRRALSRFRPTLVHIFNSEGYLWSISTAYWCRANNVPLVLTLHDPEAHPGSILAALNEKIGWITARKATLLHVLYAKFQKPVEQIYKIPAFAADPVSISRFYLDHKIEGVPREKIVLQFGRLEYYKGIDYLVNAAPLLPDDLQIIIAGPGTLNARIKEKIAALGERIEVHERYFSDAEVAALFQRSLVLALPYRQVTQSHLPAMAADFGVVTVASDIGFFRDEVPCFGGILVKHPDDPQALAAAITQATHLVPTVPVNRDRDFVAQHYSKMYAKALDLAGKK